MLYRFHCPQCGQRIKVEHDLIGSQVSCPVCQFLQVIPPSQTPFSEQSAPLGATPLSTQQKFQDVHTTRQRPNEPAANITRVKKVRTFRGSLYMFFLLASVPLFLDIVLEEKDDVNTRIENTIKALPKQAQLRADKVYNEYKLDKADIEEVLQVLPDKKIQGAWLPLYSKWHYYFTGVAAVVYLVLLGILLPRGFANFHVKVFIAFFTGTAGMAMLFMIQSIALSGRGVTSGGLIGIFFGLIGVAYSVVDNPDIGFMPLLLANIFGVGLCEELVKALPVFVIFMGRKRLRWHECCSIGMASGLGFGLVEAFSYGEMYHGLFGQMTYWTRFVSCVVSHGVSTAAAALFLHRFQGLLEDDMTWGDAFLRLLLLISIPMTLHGLYNTFATKNMVGLALAVDLFNFGWLALMIETARDKEGDQYVQVPVEGTIQDNLPMANSEIMQPGWISNHDPQVQA